MDEQENSDFLKAQAQIKAVFEEGIATINGRDYKFTTTSHSQRVKVFSFLTKIQPQMRLGDFSFLDTPEWKQVERVIGNIVMFEGSLLSRLETQWEEYPEDYITFVSMALSVISYPFLRGKNIA